MQRIHNIENICLNSLNKGNEMLSKVVDLRY